MTSQSPLSQKRKARHMHHKRACPCVWRARQTPHRLHTCKRNRTSHPHGSTPTPPGPPSSSSSSSSSSSPPLPHSLLLPHTTQHTPHHTTPHKHTQTQTHTPPRPPPQASRSSGRQQQCVALVLWFLTTAVAMECHGDRASGAAQRRRKRPTCMAAACAYCGAAGSHGNSPPQRGDAQRSTGTEQEAGRRWST